MARHAPRAFERITAMQLAASLADDIDYAKARQRKDDWHSEQRTRERARRAYCGYVEGRISTTWGHA